MLLSKSLLFVPFDALIEPQAAATKDIQRTAYGQIDFPIAKSLDQIQVFEMSSTSGVRDWFRAPFPKLANKFFVDAFLQALLVCSVNEELGAIWFKKPDNLCLAP